VNDSQEAEPTPNQPASDKPVGEPSRELLIRRELPGESAKSVPSVSAADDEAGTARVVSEPQRLLFTPPIDIYHTGEALVLRADLPGVCVERLDLQIEDNKLTLFGRVDEHLPTGGRLLHREYQVGDFYRSFILSDEVAYDRISAKMNLGVLEITLPIIPRAQPRKIHVQTE
jgi:HSP20 family protein